MGECVIATSARIFSECVWIVPRQEQRASYGTLGGLRAGGALVARGEFSIVIAGLGVATGLEPQLGPLAAAYVLF